MSDGENPRKGIPAWRGLRPYQLNTKSVSIALLMIPCKDQYLRAGIRLPFFFSVTLHRQSCSCQSLPSPPPCHESRAKQNSQRKDAKAEKAHLQTVRLLVCPPSHPLFVCVNSRVDVSDLAFGRNACHVGVFK